MHEPFPGRSHSPHRDNHIFALQAPGCVHRHIQDRTVRHLFGHAPSGAEWISHHRGCRHRPRPDCAAYWFAREPDATFPLEMRKATKPNEQT